MPLALQVSVVGGVRDDWVVRCKVIMQLRLHMCPSQLSIAVKGVTAMVWSCNGLGS